MHVAASEPCERAVNLSFVSSAHILGTVILGKQGAYLFWFVGAPV